MVPAFDPERIRRHEKADDLPVSVMSEAASFDHPGADFIAIRRQVLLAIKDLTFAQGKIPGPVCMMGHDTIPPAVTVD